MEMNKQRLRQALKDKRAALAPETKKAWDAAIVKHIAASPEFKNASALLLYAPLKGEIDLLPLVRIARAAGKPVAFPRCDTEACTMQFYELTAEKRLIPGAYGIAEPPSDAPLLNPDAKALCILPALSFDLNGNRLGYGKGYYDRFLANFPGITLGAVYASFVLRAVPTEAHDRPVALLFTERGRQKAPSAGSSPSPWRRLRSTFTQKQTASAASATRAPKNWKEYALTLFHGALHAPPILVLSIYLLLLLARPIEARLDRTTEYAGVILLQLLIFFLPAVLYGKLRGAGLSQRIRLRPPRPEHLWFLLCTLVLMVTGSLLTSILTGGIASLSGNFTLYETFTAHYSGSPMQILYVILAYALLPALCEELVFRSILCAEYEGRGAAVAITVSSLFFAMLHFSFPHFLTYLVLGLLLAFTMYATRSFFSVLLLHLLYNVFCLFGQPYLSAFYVNAGSNRIFIFCLVVLFLLFAAFAAGEARKIYHVYAKNNADSSYTKPLSVKELPRAFLTAIFTPATAGCLLLWVILSAVL